MLGMRAHTGHSYVDSYGSVVLCWLDFRLLNPLGSGFSYPSRELIHCDESILHEGMRGGCLARWNVCDKGSLPVGEVNLRLQISTKCRIPQRTRQCEWTGRRERRWWLDGLFPPGDVYMEMFFVFWIYFLCSRWALQKNRIIWSIVKLSLCFILWNYFVKVTWLRLVTLGCHRTSWIWQKCSLYLFCSFHFNFARNELKSW